MMMPNNEEGRPRHGHRTPSELAEDEIVLTVQGSFYEPPALQHQGPRLASKRAASTGMSLLLWADAHPALATN